jgi:hypothetical protein
MKHIYKTCAENLKGRDYLEDPGIDGRIILLWSLKELGWGL